MPDASPDEPPLLPTLFDADPPRSPAEAARRRRVAGFLRTYEHCAQPGCRRARACVGDPAHCVLLRWIACSHLGRVWAGAAIVALAEGASGRVAMQHAKVAFVVAAKRAERLPPG